MRRSETATLDAAVTPRTEMRLNSPSVIRMREEMREKDQPKGRRRMASNSEQCMTG